MFKAKSYDIIFFTHANNNTGFGHASRCAKLAMLLKTKNPNLRMSFWGEFTKNAKTLIRKICKFDVLFLNDGFSDIIFYDRMDDDQDPDFISDTNINYFKNKCNKMILMVNGRDIPKFQKDITYIGYKKSDKFFEQSNVLWSLKYSPVFFSKEKNETIEENKNQVLISFGGGFIQSDLDNVISSLIELDEVKIIKILLSPVNKNYEFKYNLNNKSIIYLRNVENIKNIIQQSGFVICSYGHFTYEAMSLGKILCVFAKKQFQNQYAKTLDKYKFCINCGLIDYFSKENFLENLRRAFGNQKQLRLNSKKYIAQNGLENIVNIILNQQKK